jgi:hypothetical protein
VSPPSQGPNGSQPSSARPTLSGQTSAAPTSTSANAGSILQALKDQPDVRADAFSAPGDAHSTSVGAAVGKGVAAFTLLLGLGAAAWWVATQPENPKLPQTVAQANSPNPGATASPGVAAPPASRAWVREPAPPASSASATPEAPPVVAKLEQLPEAVQSPAPAASAAAAASAPSQTLASASTPMANPIEAAVAAAAAATAATTTAKTGAAAPIADKANAARTTTPDPKVAIARVSSAKPVTAKADTRPSREASDSRPKTAGPVVARANSPPPQAKPKTDDADVALVSALMVHADGTSAGTRGGGNKAEPTLSARQEDTIAGLVSSCRAKPRDEAAQCLQTICSGYWGKAEACPVARRTSTDKASR